MGDTDARFWEIPVPPEVLEAALGPVDLDLGPDDDDDVLHHAARDAARAEMLAHLGEIVATGLTDRQRAIVHAYFYDGASQEQIAASLGISQQSVSRQLFGVIRSGRRVGGAIRRLRELCEERGLQPWV